MHPHFKIIFPKKYEKYMIEYSVIYSVSSFDPETFLYYRITIQDKNNLDMVANT